GLCGGRGPGRVWGLLPPCSLRQMLRDSDGPRFPAGLPGGLRDGYRPPTVLTGDARRPFRQYRLNKIAPLQDIRPLQADQVMSDDAMAAAASSQEGLTRIPKAANDQGTLRPNDLGPDIVSVLRLYVGLDVADRALPESQVHDPGHNVSKLGNL